MLNPSSSLERAYGPSLKAKNIQKIDDEVQRIYERSLTKDVNLLQGNRSSVALQKPYQQLEIMVPSHGHSRVDTLL